MEETPNGRVTNAQLYKALYDLSCRVDERFNILQKELNLHREISHKPPPSTAKTGGIAGAVALVVTILAGVGRALGLGY